MQRYSKTRRAAMLDPAVRKRILSNPLTMWMDLNDKRQSEVALKLGTYPSLINAWQIGASTPHPLMMEKLAELMEIERETLEQEWVDWKYGNDPGRLKKENWLRSNPIQHFMDRRGFSIDDIALTTETAPNNPLKRPTLRKWLRGESAPTKVTDVMAVAQFMYWNAATEEELPRLNPEPPDTDDDEVLPIDLQAFLKKLQDWRHKPWNEMAKMGREVRLASEFAHEHDGKKTPFKINLFAHWLNERGSRWDVDRIAVATDATTPMVRAWLKGNQTPTDKQISTLAKIMGMKIATLTTSFHLQPAHKKTR